MDSSTFSPLLSPSMFDKLNGTMTMQTYAQEERKDVKLTLNVQLRVKFSCGGSISLYLGRVSIGTVGEYFNAGRAKY